jgi:hypothetical protein
LPSKATSQPKLYCRQTSSAHVSAVIHLSWKSAFQQASKNACITNLLSIVALVRTAAKSKSDQRYKEKQAMLQATREGLKMSPAE